MAANTLQSSLHIVRVAALTDALLSGRESVEFSSVASVVERLFQIALADGEELTLHDNSSVQLWQVHTPWFHVKIKLF